MKGETTGKSTKENQQKEFNIHWKEGSKEKTEMEGGEFSKKGPKEIHHKSLQI